MSATDVTPTALPTPILPPGESLFHRWEAVKEGGALRVFRAVELPLSSLILALARLTPEPGDERRSRRVTYGTISILSQLPVISR